MVTRKKDKKVRDADATKRKLLDAVGEIVAASGFHELGVNKIAQMAERDKGLIRYHFKGLNNLLRAYIDEKDYWPPFFERYKMDAHADQGEIREMFVALMQENLKQFYASKEMQKIILWQITEPSALLRHISEGRESQGEKLLNLTNPTFLNSGVNFKAVIALLLGGSYFAVLQASAIKSKVCGIDLNWAHDYQEYLKTIEQVISWAYEKANTEIKSSSIPMNYELEHLEGLAAELALQKEDPELPRQSPDVLLEIEARTVEKILSQQLLTLTNETQIVTFLQVYLGKLVKLCDKLYRPELSANPDAEVLLELIEAIRRPVAQYVPETMVLPELCRVKEGEKFALQWERIVAVLQESGLDQRLLDIVQVPLLQFLSAKEPMRWCDFKYLKRYLGVLSDEVSAEVSQTGLLELLAGLGFNYTRFTVYYTDAVNEKLAGLDVGAARDVLSAELLRLSRMTIYTHRQFDRHKLPVMEELGKWLTARKSGYEEQQNGMNPFKLISRFKGVQLAFWKKLEYDHGIYEEDNLEVFSEKIAYNYSTRSQEELSAQSIKSKFYPKDALILRAIEKVLLAMLEDVRKFL